VTQGAPSAATTIFVCVTCRGAEDAEARPGRVFYEALGERLKQGDAPSVEVVPVECLSICKRPTSVALVAPGKWTYVITGLEPAPHVEDIVTAAKLHAESQDGVPPWRERPECFRRNVVSRTPPLFAKPREA
jgi:predicted metal-binding protein